MTMWTFNQWGYPANPEHPQYTTRYKCRVHDVVNDMVKVEVRNSDYDVVFDRRYCSICFDAFLQRHLEPLQEVKQDG